MSTGDSGSKPTDRGKRSTGSGRHLVLAFGKSYIRGLIALGIAYALWRGIERAWASAEQLGARPFLYVLLTLLLAPPVLGWLIGRLLYPWLRRFHLMRAVLRGEERLFAEFAPDSRRGFPVVLVNWPNANVRSFAVVTATYPGPEPGRELATVFLPGTPDVRRGSVRVVPVEELEFTDWSLAECLRLHVTHGMHSPGFLQNPAGGAPPAAR